MAEQPGWPEEGDPGGQDYQESTTIDERMWWLGPKPTREAELQRKRDLAWLGLWLVVIFLLALVLGVVGHSAFRPVPGPTLTPYEAAHIGPVKFGMVCLEEHGTGVYHVGRAYGPMAAYSLSCGEGPRTAANQLNVEGYCNQFGLHAFFVMTRARSWMCKR